MGENLVAARGNKGEKNRASRLTEDRVGRTLLSACF
jgi:hypothetical protein